MKAITDVLKVNWRAENKKWC